MFSTVLSSEVAKVWAIWVTPVCTRGHRTQLQSPCAVNVGPTWSSLRAGRSLRIENPLSCSLYPRLCVRVSCSVVSDSSWPNGLQPARILCPWTSPGKNNEVDSQPFYQGSSQPRNQIWVSCIAGRFFAIWATSIFLTSQTIFVKWMYESNKSMNPGIKWSLSGCLVLLFLSWDRWMA